MQCLLQSTKHAFIIVQGVNAFYIYTKLRKGIDFQYCVNLIRGMIFGPKRKKETLDEKTRFIICNHIFTIYK